MTQSAPRLERIADHIPHKYPGPGGAIAVLRRGEVLVRQSWGWANAEQRFPFTPRTLFRMCSITKQFTCALLLSSFPDPTRLDMDIGARLPELESPPPTTLHLCHNQSGLRDYWAVAMLHGSPPEAPFGEIEAGRVIAGQRSLQFTPGTRYSYANQNFRILSDVLQDRTGRGFAELLRTKIFGPAGMESAFLAADTRAMPDGTEGYEGSPDHGWRPAVNRIRWTGDAGLGACLDDMIAWERHIDATRDDAAALYSGLVQPVQFADGNPASYGFGLNRRTEFGQFVTAHGGGLRGWRSHRLYAHNDRISVIVLFNHLSDAQGAARELLAAALDREPPRPDPAIPHPQWLGMYQDPESGLAARIEAAAPGQVLLRYVYPAERLELKSDGSAGSSVRLIPTSAGVRLQRPQDNSDVLLSPCAPAIQADIAGRYHCRELDCELTISQSPGHVLYAGFSGCLGIGRMEELTPIGRDIYLLPCLRALDYSPPGEWTIQIHRDLAGKIASLQVGTWLARNISYTPVVNS